MKYIFSVLGLLFFCTGCGDDASDLPAEATELKQRDETAFLKDWEKRCVSDNEPLIETRYQQCLLAPGIYGSEGCENGKLENTLRLHAAWDFVTSTAEANYLQCSGDVRTYNEFCVGQYEFEISFLVSLKCQEAATWN